jgi:inosose dehydratase
MIRYGTNPIAWSNDDDRSIGAHIPLEQCLSEAAAIGFDGIELGHKFPTEPDKLRTILRNDGLALVSGWYSLGLLGRSVDEEIEAITHHLTLLKALDATECIVCETSNAIHGRDSVALVDRPTLTPAALKDFGTRLESVAEYCAEYRLDLVYHHHMGTIIQSRADIDSLMEATGPATKLLLDTGHAWFGGADPTALARDHMSRVRHIHAKNIRAPIMEEVGIKRLSFLEAVRRGVFTVPGDPEGCIDFDPVLEIAAKHGYQGWLVIEAEQDPTIYDPVKYQSMGLTALRRLAHDVGLDRRDE